MWHMHITLYWLVLKVMDAGYCLYVHIFMKTLNHLNHLIFTILINSRQTSGFSKVGAIIKYNIMHFPVLIKTVLKLVYIIMQSKSKAKQRCVMGVGMCLYAQLMQTKNKQCKSAIISLSYRVLPKKNPGPKRVTNGKNFVLNFVSAFWHTGM